MIHESGDALVEVVIELIHRVGVRVVGLAHQTAPAHDQSAQILADLGVIGEVFRNDVAGTCNGLFHRCNAFFFIQKALSQLFNILPILGKDGLCQRA